MKVIAFTCCAITVIFLLATMGATDWVQSNGWQEGLFNQCARPGIPTPLPFSEGKSFNGCKRAHSAGYVRGAAALVVIAFLTDFFGTLLTGLGLRSTDPNKKYKYYRVAIYSLGVAILALFLALIIYPTSMTKDMEAEPPLDGGISIVGDLDFDNDGIPDIADDDDDNDGTIDSLDDDDDNDGIKDDVDDDDDNDGIPDEVELADATDADGDGVPDAADNDDDNDGVPDDQDTDDDNDGIPDHIEMTTTMTVFPMPLRLIPMVMALLMLKTMMMMEMVLLTVKMRTAMTMTTTMMVFLTVRKQLIQITTVFQMKWIMMMTMMVFLIIWTRMTMEMVLMMMRTMVLKENGILDSGLELLGCVSF